MVRAGRPELSKGPLPRPSAPNRIGPSRQSSRYLWDTGAQALGWQLNPQLLSVALSTPQMKETRPVLSDCDGIHFPSLVPFLPANFLQGYCWGVCVYVCTHRCICMVEGAYA